MRRRARNKPKSGNSHKGRPAVRLRGVGKQYRLYRSLHDQALDVLGLSWLQFWRGIHYDTFTALKGINLDIKHGERVGLVGRNGAGKTTLLKLILGNVQPTAGWIEIDGSVQALMHVGLGFHSEFTGRENIRASLLYNGLAGNELEAAFEDVVDFSELDGFINQPLKSYSAGMRARLQFAVATAVKADILIVDEVLGAGDAYFSAKSAARMETLASSGCTLLLVSHSSQQVLQFCERVVWIEQGEIVLDGKADAIVQAYEHFTTKLEQELQRQPPDIHKSILHDDELRRTILTEVLASERASPHA